MGPSLCESREKVDLKWGLATLQDQTITMGVIILRAFPLVFSAMLLPPGLRHLKVCFLTGAGEQKSQI